MKVFHRDSSLNIFWYACLFFIVLIYHLSAQEISTNRWQVDSLIVISQKNYSYKFPARHVFDKQTLSISKNNIPLFEVQDYTFPASKTIRFLPAPAIGDSVRISYQRLPFNLKDTYFLFKKDTLDLSQLDSTKMDSSQIRLLPTELENPFEDFGRHDFSNNIFFKFCLCQRYFGKDQM